MHFFRCPTIRVIGPNAGWISASQPSEIWTGSAAWNGLKSTLGVESRPGSCGCVVGKVGGDGCMCDYAAVMMAHPSARPRGPRKDTLGSVDETRLAELDASRPAGLAAVLTWAVSALVVLVIVSVSTGCRRRTGDPERRVADSPESGELAAWVTRGLPCLKRLWKLPGVWTNQSLLDVDPQGHTLLALGKGAGRMPDLLAVDIESGVPRWRTPLMHQEGLALSIVGSRAIVHDSLYNLAAFDLNSGRSLWSTKLNCQIEAGEIGAAGDDYAVAGCEHGASAEALAINARTGALIWRRPIPQYGSTVYLDNQRVWLYSLEEDKALAAHTRKAGLSYLHSLNSSPVLRALDVKTGENLVEAIAMRGRKQPFPERASNVFLLPLPSRRGVLPIVVVDGRYRSWQPETPTCTVAKFGSGCMANLQHEVHLIERAGRLLQVRCREIAEIDQTTGAEVASWPLPEMPEFPEPSVLALDFVRGYLVVVLGSHDELQPGRIVIFDSQKVPTVAVAPGADPDLVALTEGILVVRRGHTARISGRKDPGAEEIQLEGYSVSDLVGEDTAPPLSDLGRVRVAIAGHGFLQPERCSLWRTSFDAMAAFKLAAIPGWEQHISALLKDRDDKVQIAAVAAAVHLRSSVVANVFMRSVDQHPRSYWEPTQGIGGHRESDWWTRIQEREEWSRELSAMALIEMNWEEAIPQLGMVLREDPMPAYVHETGCSPLAVAICGFLRDSASPQAKAALAAYDERIGSQGAWRVLCDPARNLWQ